MLVALALIYSAWPLYRAFLPLQIDVNEPWNAYHADMLTAGEALYSFNDLITNNYPPLSFYVVRSFSSVSGVDALYVGRMLSLAATAATTLSVWVCARRLGASPLAAGVGAFWWLASMTRFYSRYVGLDEPHLAGLAIMTWALALALSKNGGIRTALAIVLMAVAGFYKDDLFAIPAATLCWFTVQDRYRGLQLTLLGVATVALGFAICGALFGEAFFHSLFLPRHYDITRLGSIGRLQFIAPALLAAAVWAICRRRDAAPQFVLTLIFVGLFSYLGQVLADGVGDNAAFELVFAVAIGIACALDDLAGIPGVRRFGAGRARILVLCILIGRLLISARVSAYQLLLSPNFRSDLEDRVSVMQSESARIAGISGPVVCSVALVCRFAGKPFVFDPFVVGEYVATGRISRTGLSREINEQNIRFELIDPRTDVSNLL